MVPSETTMMSASGATSSAAIDALADLLDADGRL
jgi:hypothetical protein